MITVTVVQATNHNGGSTTDPDLHVADSKNTVVSRGTNNVEQSEGTPIYCICSEWKNHAKIHLEYHKPDTCI